MGRTVALSAQSYHPGTIKALLPALVNTRALRLLDSVALTFLDEPPLHLRYHSERREHDMPHFASGRNVRIEHRDERALLLAFVDQVENVTRVASKPVEAGHHQLVTRAKEIQNRGQFGAAVAAAARYLLRATALA